MMFAGASYFEMRQQKTRASKILLVHARKYLHPAFSLLCYNATLTAAATKTKPIGDSEDRQFTIIVNSTSTAAPIGLPPKMAEFCHTSNRL
jgi:hypothetical protein